MSLISLLVALLIAGFLLYLINLMPIDATIKKIAQAVVLFILILWVIEALGLLTMGPTIGFRR